MFAALRPCILTLPFTHCSLLSVLALYLKLGGNCFQCVAVPASATDITVNPLPIFIIAKYATRKTARSSRLQLMKRSVSTTVSNGMRATRLSHLWMTSSSPSEPIKHFVYTTQRDKNAQASKGIFCLLFVLL